MTINNMLLFRNQKFQEQCTFIYPALTYPDPHFKLGVGHLHKSTLLFFSADISLIFFFLSGSWGAQDVPLVLLGISHRMGTVCTHVSHVIQVCTTLFPSLME